MENARAVLHEFHSVVVQEMFNERRVSLVEMDSDHPLINLIFMPDQLIAARKVMRRPSDGK